MALPADLPLEVLNDGNWEELRRAFGLPDASTLITITTETEAATPADLDGLTTTDWVRLTALLTAKGADLKATARRLGRLRVMRCNGIRTAFSLDGFRASEDRTIHLQAEEDRGRLFVVEPFSEDSRTELAAELARYLGERSQQQSIHLYLALGEQLLAPLGVGAAALEEAEEALRRYVKSAEQDRGAALQPAAPKERDDSGAVDEEPEPEVSEDGAAAGTEQEGRKPELNPAIKTTFGGGGRIGGAAPTEDTVPAVAEVTFTEGAPGQARPVGSRPSGARGGTGRSGSPSVSTESRRAVERAAIEIAARFAFHELGCAEVRDVQESNTGWDLELCFPAGGGRWRLKDSPAGSVLSS